MDEKIYQISEGVQIIRRDSSLLFFSGNTGRSVRVSPMASEIIPLLKNGAIFEQLHAKLALLKPNAQDIKAKLQLFLGQLVDSGILSLDGTTISTEKTPKIGMYPLFNLNYFAGLLAQPIAKLPIFLRRMVLVLLLLASITALTQLAIHQALPDLNHLMENISIIGVGLFFLLVVPVHELAHAVTCRITGIDVGMAGIIIHGGIIPGPYVDTTNIYQHSLRWPRFIIPAAGPIINIFAAGFFAFLLDNYEWSQQVQGILYSLLFFSLIFVYSDTNPLTPSDGSHCIEALLNDELLRRSALSRYSSSNRSLFGLSKVNIYRMLTIIHLATSAIIAYWWW